MSITDVTIVPLLGSRTVFTYPCVLVCNYTCLSWLGILVDDEVVLAINKLQIASIAFLGYEFRTSERYVGAIGAIGN